MSDLNDRYNEDSSLTGPIDDYDLRLDSGSVNGPLQVRFHIPPFHNPSPRRLRVQDTEGVHPYNLKTWWEQDKGSDSRFHLLV